MIDFNDATVAFDTVTVVEEVDLGVVVGNSATLRTALYPSLVVVRVPPKIAVAR